MQAGGLGKGTYEPQAPSPLLSAASVVQLVAFCEDLQLLLYECVVAIQT